MKKRDVGIFFDHGIENGIERFLILAIRKFVREASLRPLEDGLLSLTSDVAYRFGIAERQRNQELSPG